jgi:hypothetical protein
VSIRFTCPSCASVSNAPDDAAGKKARCPNCGHISRIPAAGILVPQGEPPPVSGGPPAGSVELASQVPVLDEAPRYPERDEAGDDRPGRGTSDRRRWDDDYDLEPEPRRPRRGHREPEDDGAGEREPLSAGRVLAQVFIRCGFVAVLLATALTGLGWLAGMRQANSAIQEASVSASAAAVMIGFYVAARSVEKVIGP